MKSESLCRNMIEERGCDSMVIDWGNLARPVCSNSSLCPFIFRNKDVLFLLVQEGHFSYEGQEWQWESQRDLPASVIFQYSKMVCFGVVSPKSHHFPHFLFFDANVILVPNQLVSYFQGGCPETQCLWDKMEYKQLLPGYL